MELTLRKPVPLATRLRPSRSEGQDGAYAPTSSDLEGLPWGFVAGATPSTNTRNVTGEGGPRRSGPLRLEGGLDVLLA
jgi:hypothetical protein